MQSRARFDKPCQATLPNQLLERWREAGLMSSETPEAIRRPATIAATTAASR
jgi:hypothetical protein